MLNKLSNNFLRILQEISEKLREITLVHSLRYTEVKSRMEYLYFCYLNPQIFYIHIAFLL